jgi:glycosyltransferase involved in cell wall biosynthesis
MLVMNNLVSVIVPVYNAEAYLKMGIQNIINQTYTNIEIILVDDGSQDKSANICDELSEYDKRIKVIHKTNGGVSSARNAALEIAKGTYICFIDADDVVEKTLIETMVSIIKTDETELVICGYKIVAIRETIRQIERTTTNDFFSNPNLFWKIMDNGMLNTLWNKLFVHAKIGKFQEEVSMGEDLLFVLDYLEGIRKVSIIPDLLYQYVKRVGSTTSKFRYDLLENTIELINRRQTFVEYHFKNQNLKAYLYEKSLTEIYGVFRSVINDQLNRKEAIEVLEKWKASYEYIHFVEINGVPNNLFTSTSKLYYKLYFLSWAKRIVRKYLKRLVFLNFRMK